MRYEARDRSARRERTRDANRQPPDTPTAGGLLPAPPAGACRHSLYRLRIAYLSHMIGCDLNS